MLTTQIANVPHLSIQLSQKNSIFEPHFTSQCFVLGDS